jgi:hypothetical protein
MEMDLVVKIRYNLQINYAKVQLENNKNRF